MGEYIKTPHDRFLIGTCPKCGFEESYGDQEFKKIPIKNLFINVDDDYYIFKKDLKIIIDS